MTNNQISSTAAPCSYFHERLLPLLRVDRITVAADYYVHDLNFDSRQVCNDFHAQVFLGGLCLVVVP